MNTSQNNYQQILKTNIYKLGATALACAPAKKTKQMLTDQDREKIKTND